MSARTYATMCLLLVPATLRAERELPPVEKYQARFYQELGAECLTRTGPAPTCIELLETSLRFDAGAAPVHFTLGHYYAAVGDFARAAGSFARAVELDPTLVAAWIALGDLACAQKDFAAARRHYQRYVEQAPNGWEGHYNLGALAALELDEGAALASLARAIERGFSDPARLREDPRWRSVVGSPELDRLVAPLQTDRK